MEGSWAIIPSSASSRTGPSRMIVVFSPALFFAAASCSPVETTRKTYCFENAGASFFFRTGRQSGSPCTGMVSFDSFSERRERASLRSWFRAPTGMKALPSVVTERSRRTKSEFPVFASFSRMFSSVIGRLFAGETGILLTAVTVTSPAQRVSSAGFPETRTARPVTAACGRLSRYSSRIFARSFSSAPA